MTTYTSAYGGAEAVEWEIVDHVPPARKGGGRPNTPRGGEPLILEPGQILRRPVDGKAAAAGYHTLFKRTGRVDHHAAIRLIDGQWWCYIWRDAT